MTMKKWSCVVHVSNGYRGSAYKVCSLTDIAYVHQAVVLVIKSLQNAYIKRILLNVYITVVDMTRCLTC